MDLDFIRSMAHSPIHNYAIPGLTSYLVGPPPSKQYQGCVRLFHSSREHVEPIAPHSHRFDFQALVLEGRVINRLWREVPEGFGDSYHMDCLTYQGKPGHYKRERMATRRYKFEDETFERGQSYGMTSEDIHSIYFGRDTWVLMLEGPSRFNMSHVLTPDTDWGEVDTAKVEPWMFIKG